MTQEQRKAVRNIPSCPLCQESYRSGATANASMQAIEYAYDCDACLEIVVEACTVMVAERK